MHGYDSDSMCAWDFLLDWRLGDMHFMPCELSVHLDDSSASDMPTWLQGRLWDQHVRRLSCWQRVPQRSY